MRRKHEAFWAISVGGGKKLTGILEIRTVVGGGMKLIRRLEV
jgi:hypothetical protein